MPGDPTATNPPLGHLPIGRLGRAFQLEGGIRLVFTGPYGPSALDTVGRVFVVGYGPAALRRVRRHADATIVYLDGVRDRETAAALTGAEVFAEPVELPAPEGTAGVDAGGPETEALIGAEVVLEGRPVGRVREVRFAPLNPVLVVNASAGEVLLPLAAPYVVVRQGWVELLDPPAGLLERS